MPETFFKKPKTQLAFMIGITIHVCERLDEPDNPQSVAQNDWHICRQTSVEPRLLVHCGCFSVG